MTESKILNSANAALPIHHWQCFNPIYKPWLSEWETWLEPYFQTATPGVVLEVYQGGKLSLSYRGGATYEWYDLASLTKVLFTVPLLMQSFSEGLWNSETRLSAILSWWPESEIKVIDLLTHTSGLVWWKPLYREMVLKTEGVPRWHFLREQLCAAALEVQPKTARKSVYSDMGFLTLAFVLEALYQKELPALWEQTKTLFAPQSELHWNPVSGMMPPPSQRAHDPHSHSPHSHDPRDSRDPRSYAPTEDCSWRGRRLQGEVQDENAWALGGLSTHAGLFGGASDVASVFLSLRQMVQNSGHPLHSTVRWFLQRHTPVEQGDWALGMMLPTKGSSSSGQYFSPHSLGHTGYTGTSAWWDPERDLLIVLLSNRLYYGRRNQAFAQLRPLLHDRIVRASEGKENTHD